jgi:hypothetical protein
MLPPGVVNLVDQPLHFCRSWLRLPEAPRKHGSYISASAVADHPKHSLRIGAGHVHPQRTGSDADIALGTFSVGDGSIDLGSVERAKGALERCEHGV